MKLQKEIKSSFSPLVNENSEILILGSIPGEESLRKQEYYGNRRNQFWPIMIKLFSGSEQLSYDNKLKFLLDNKIALWDVIDKCKREGSLDSNIREEKLNDFILFFETYPRIRKVCFNGQKAYNSFKKIKGLSRFNLILELLPSTSPAYTIPFERKLKEWEEIIKNQKMKKILSKMEFALLKNSTNPGSKCRPE